MDIEERPFSDQVWYLELPRRHIAELIMIIEGYEGLAVTRVLSKEPGVAEMLVAPDQADVVSMVIEDLKNYFPVRRIERPEGVYSVADD